MLGVLDADYEVACWKGRKWHEQGLAATINYQDGTVKASIPRSCFARWGSGSTAWIRASADCTTKGDQWGSLWNGVLHSQALSG